MHNSFATIKKKSLFNNPEKEKIQFMTKLRASIAFLPVFHKRNANMVRGILFLVTG